ncbi:UDP-2,3-diacylglucosamine diphosphatase [Dysgonomonas macrotermitis]|uniref:UDP-2,3-diacylglucosamine hydrolase n=1 Tax=Dysgonomonas macrotermitis TaxID=1346286 RepID=A0A1M5DYP2_9BACT|nr:UDP-2,3-diacylglucosamine diphosphatase [Dysgonomonas macrotermitis]SHF72089.1 UDP-2,3-diacylglucosamine hydrolase [Dysgonomonas macrotermitis]
MSEKKKIYFLSDVHLGSASHTNNKTREEDKGLLTLPNSKKPSDNSFLNHDVERKLCRWFDSVKSDAKTIYLLGDIFDFWFEYKYVVPRGFTRVLGKIAELTDSGIEIHFFIGNHDVWLTDYLQKECGMIIHTEPLVVDLYGKKFFLAHGDGLGDESKSFKIIRYLFHNKFCQKAFATLHPRWALAIAHKWSNHSRATGGVIKYLGEDKEYLVLFAKKELEISPAINFFVFGHRHIMLDLMLSASSRIIILGDWITFFSYAVFDGKTMSLEVFEEES